MMPSSRSLLFASPATEEVSFPLNLKTANALQITFGIRGFPFRTF